MSIIACSADECERESKRRGLCGKHYARALKRGEYGAKKPCIWPSCDLIGHTRSLCTTHHKRSYEMGHPDNPWEIWDERVALKASELSGRTCKWPECESSKLKGYGMCHKHYTRAVVLGSMDSPWDDWIRKVECRNCGVAFETPVHNKEFCSPKCFRAVYRQRNLEKLLVSSRENSRRRHAWKLNSQVEKFTDQDVRDLHGDDCYLCGFEIDYALKFPDPRSRSVDHIVPLSRGGSHTLDNVAMTHLRCNMSKNAKPIGLGPQIALF